MLVDIKKPLHVSLCFLPTLAQYQPSPPLTFGGLRQEH